MYMCGCNARLTLASFNIDAIALSASTHGEHDIEGGELVFLCGVGILGGDVAEKDRHVEDMVVEGEVVAAVEWGGCQWGSRRRSLTAVPADQWEGGLSTTARAPPFPRLNRRERLRTSG